MELWKCVFLSDFRQIHHTKYKIIARENPAGGTLIGFWLVFFRLSLFHGRFLSTDPDPAGLSETAFWAFSEGKAKMKNYLRNCMTECFDKPGDWQSGRFR